MRRPAVLLAAALLLLALLPSDAWAWTPGTHILLGESLLRAADVLLPAGLASLLKAYPYDFLYGSIAADTSFAKRYARVGQHCHHWPVADDILGRARDDALRAFGYGYLAHLAADVVAHNHFVPHQLAISGATAGAGHSYWEARFESVTGDRWPRRAREVILLDHQRADEHLDRILSPTIFSTRTNRRIFRGMVTVNDLASWQRVLAAVAARSRVPLRDATVAAHLERSFDYIVDLLAHGEASTPRRFDPSGEAALREAKQLRKAALAVGGERVARREAATRFGLGESALGFAARLPAPLHAGQSPASPADARPA
ncbi:MAG: zinc dependent phospholipase C family protein [Gemmatimonadaceae bacterium]|nr:zinc dependent phospholipase C family protein [Gemmatimonadaceae bacterium]